MMQRQKLILAIFSGIALILLPTQRPLPADIVFTVSQVNTNVIVEASGTLNTDAWSYFTTQSTAGVLNARGSGVVGQGTYDQYRSPVNLISTAPWGSGTTTMGANANSGDVFGINVISPTTPILAVPVDYVSGTFLSGTSLHANRTIASLGLTPGEYVQSWGSGASADSFTVRIVPEPAAAWLVTAIAGFGLIRRRHRPVA